MSSREGVVRAQFRTCVFIEDALEQRAEDGGLDVSPVHRVQLLKDRDLSAKQFVGHVIIREEPAVELGDAPPEDTAARVHRLEQLAQPGLQRLRVIPVRADTV